VNLLKQKKCLLEQKDHLFINIWGIISIILMTNNNSRTVSGTGKK